MVNRREVSVGSENMASPAESLWRKRVSTATRSVNGDDDSVHLHVVKGYGSLEKNGLSIMYYINEFLLVIHISLTKAPSSLSPSSVCSSTPSHLH